MFLIVTYHFTGTIVIYLTGAEYWLEIIRAIRLETLEIVIEFHGYVAERKLLINVDDGIGLCRLDIFRNILLEAAGKLLNIFYLE